MNAAEIRATATLGAIFALRMLGLFMIIPVFSIYGREYAGATPLLIGVAVGIYGLAQAALQIPVSMLAERFPRKPIIIAGLLLFALGGAVAALATDIWQVILGRFLAGAGAVSAVIMALLADVTREQTRNKAMAMMGFIIGGSIFLAFVLGPVLAAVVGISGLFWLTCLGGFLGILLVFLAPTAQRTLSYHHFQMGQSSHTSAAGKLAHIFTFTNLNRLYVAVFTLHLLMTAIFVRIPIDLETLGVPLAKHAWVYLPLLLLGFVLAVPLIIVAEKYRKMRLLLLAGMAMMALGLLVLAGAAWLFSASAAHTRSMGMPLALVMLGLGVFFVGFNLLEAMIPSWLSKQAPIAYKNTVMGISASSQFFGAFVGGTLGGLLLSQTAHTAWLVCMLFAVLAWLLLYHISSPPYLTSLTASLPKENVATWQAEIHSIKGVEDMVLLAKEGVAYIKIDKQKFTDRTRQKLSHLIQQTLDF